MLAFSLIIYQHRRKTNIQIPVQSFSSFKYCAIYPMNGDDLIMTPIKPAAYPFSTNYRQYVKIFLMRTWRKQTWICYNYAVSKKSWLLAEVFMKAVITVLGQTVLGLSHRSRGTGRGRYQYTGYLPNHYAEYLYHDHAGGSQ